MKMKIVASRTGVIVLRLLGIQAKARQFGIKEHFENFTLVDLFQIAFEIT